MSKMIMMLFCGIANAEMYKCIGKDGKTKYQASKCDISAKSSVIESPVPLSIEELDAKLKNKMKI